jgi:anaerobic ribonucleoside-triphosphate reductase activating protein
MRYAKIKKNDIANGPGVGVSVYLQGCPHHCYNCFNQETWDFNGGYEFTYDTLKEIIEAIGENGIERHLSLLGGDPLCPENLFLSDLIVKTVKENYPNIKIYVWTGYIYETLLESENPYLKDILDTTDVLIDGPFIESEKDLSLAMRGSRNQRIINLKEQN